MQVCVCVRVSIQMSQCFALVALRLSFLFLCPFDTSASPVGAQLCLVRKRCSCFMAVYQFFLLYRLLQSSFALSPFMASTESLVRSADEVEAELSNLRSRDVVFHIRLLLLLIIRLLLLTIRGPRVRAGGTGLCGRYTALPGTLRVCVRAPRAGVRLFPGL